VAAAALAGGALAAATLWARDVNAPWLLLVGLVVLVTVLAVLGAATLGRQAHEPVAPPRTGRGERGLERSASQRPAPQPPARRPSAAAQQPPAPQPPAPRPSAAAPPGSVWPGVTSPSNAGGGGWAGIATASTPATQWPSEAKLEWPQPESPQQAAPQPESGPAPASVAIPVSGQAWWEATTAEGRAAAPRPGAEPEAARAATEEGVASATGSVDDGAAGGALTRVVQCPRCGDFGVDVRHREPGFAFACGRCGNQWRWQPGSAWPATVVRPRRKHRPTADPLGSS
jgi:hypothetical protein